jgi:hypothetical protein
VFLGLLEGKEEPVLSIAFCVAFVAVPPQARAQNEYVLTISYYTDGTYGGGACV